MSEQYLTEQRFAQFDLPEPLLRGLREAGLERCTPIQAEALPLLLAGQDVAGQAQTGTGKTATFLVACFTYLERNPCPEGRVHTQPRAIMLAPTRELALQIFKDAESLGRHMGYKLAVVYGGKDYAKQRQNLESGVDILIGTPGRLIDYYKQKVFDLKAVQVLVLDEADRMFDLGFIRDIRFVLRRMPDPEQRLNMLFSATLSLRVNELAYEHMNNPQVVKIESAHLTVDRVEQQVLFPSNREKIPLLLGLLSRIGAVRTLVFVNTKQAAETVETWLRGNGYDAGVLSGDVPQPKRERLLQKFKSGDVPILVATDVAARGLHIPDVSHVINFDLPQDPEDYVHRVGRTARAGASGDAISFACETYAISLMDIEAFIGRSIPVTKIDTSWLVEPKPPAKREHRSRRAIHKDRQTEKKVVTNKAAPKHRHGKSSHKEPARKKPVEDDANKRPAAKAGPKRRIPETPAVG